MKRKTIIIGSGSLLLLALAFGLFVYFTEFYRAWPPYAFGIRNDSGDVLRDAAVRLFPKGGFEFGIIGSNPASYEDPPWPLPEKFLVSFSDESGKRYEIEVASGVGRKFKGRLTIVVKKNASGYYAEVEQSSLTR